MPRIEPRIIPDDYYAHDLKDLNTLLVALRRLVEVKEVMTIEDAAAFLSCSVRKINDMCQHGKLPYHRLDGLAGKLFLRTELIEFVKRH